MNERQIVHVNNGSLILRKILQSDSGIYNCTVVAITQLDHKFQSNNKMNRGGTFYSENNKNSRSRKVKSNEKERHESTNGFKSASSSMRIKVIGKTS